MAMAKRAKKLNNKERFMNSITTLLLSSIEVIPLRLVLRAVVPVATSVPILISHDFSVFFGSKVIPKIVFQTY